MRRQRILAFLLPLVLAGCAWAQASKPNASADHTYRAAEALFRSSDLDLARRELALAFRANAYDTRALFVAMELAALEGDDDGVLKAGTRLCESAQTQADDEMCEIAAGRIAEMAANTRAFRQQIPSIRRLIASGSPQSDTLRLALVAAAKDGAPELDLLLQSRESGLLTDWQIVGPVGRLSNTDFDRKFPPEQDGVRKKAYGTRQVQAYQFANGLVDLPKRPEANGVYYAASDLWLRSSGQWRVWVETSGTLEILIDGKRALRKDVRSQDQPHVMWQVLHVNSGRHRVVVKFIPTALPFRVAIMTPAAGVKRRYNKPAIHAGAEAEYAAVALRYWRRDFTGTVRRLTQQADGNAAAKLLLASAWVKASRANAPEARTALLAAEKAAPSSPVIQHRLAEFASQSDRREEVLVRLKRVLDARPAYEPALRLFARTAAQLRWRTEAAQAYERLVLLHPSCQNVKDAAQYLAGVGEYDRADALQAEVKRCVPDSRLPSHWLARAVGHVEADDGPWQESGREIDQNPRAAGFFAGTEFFGAYRRDGFGVVREAEKRNFSGGPSVILLHDKVALVQKKRITAVYVHTLTRVLNREGIEQCGEVKVPANAEILNLRTIKRDGSVVEPELTAHKPTVSMPALSAGDAIELEYVLWHAGEGGIAATHSDLEFVFGSFAAPIVAARFVLLGPDDLELEQLNEPPKAREHETADGIRVRTWERENIAQSSREAHLPTFDLLPVVRVLGTKESRIPVNSVARENQVKATRAGVRVLLLADHFDKSDPEALAAALYSHVTSSIKSDTSDFANGYVTSAEQTLAGNRGSRTAVLLALARATGLTAELALAGSQTSAAGPATHVLVVFRLGRNGEHDVVVDPESEGMPFGILSPSLDRSKALLVSRVAEDDASAWIRLPAVESRHLSVAEGEIDFESDGSFTARVKIVMGAERGAQMRGILRGIAQTERKHFFEQLASRLFPGAGDAQGSVENESSPDQPLRMEIICSARRNLILAAATVDIDQLVPSLGLKKLYGGRRARRWPLLVDSLLYESATFHVRFPQNVRVLRTVPDLDMRTEFGSYRATFNRVGNNELVIRREFNIPPQVIPAERYANFSAFAARIDDTERQRLTLAVEREQAAGRRTGFNK